MLDLLWGGVNLLLALLTTTTKAEDEMEGALLLDVVVRKGTTVFELFSSEDQALLIWGDPLLVLYSTPSVSLREHVAQVLNFGGCTDLALDIVDGVRRLNLKGDSFTREGLDENLHCCLKKPQVKPYNLRYFDTLRRRTN